ncbi:MAG: riboflavin biosynthesis protein RibF [Clostridia bacterium]|nr:riboflavin biosynthesis protein RibF [Clostridia bacterium]
MDLRGGHIRPSEAPPPPTVLCLGNFDGVHLAHAALLRAGMDLAAGLQNTEGPASPVLCGVFCFFSPSGDYFLKENTQPTHLTTLEERLTALMALGADLVWLCDFPAVRELPSADFIRLLRNDCGCVGVACGYNHRFGKGAEGSPALLTEAFGVGRTAVLPALKMDGIPVSSSRIRSCLLAGDVETAARLLGRPYALDTTVVHGKSLGHTWGFPTANQYFPAERLIPAHGVYAVRCHTPGGIFPGVANVGLRPTVEDPGRVNCETHIMGFAGDLYDRPLKVEFLKFLRPEQKFDSVEALTAAIRRDTETAAAYVTSLGPAPY